MGRLTLLGVGTSSLPAPNLIYRGYSPTSGATHTIGAAAADRLVVAVVAGHRSLAPARTLTSVTIAGVAATVHATEADASQGVTLGIASRLVTTGTTAVVSWVLSGAVTNNDVYVYTITGLISATPTATLAAYDASGDASGSITVAANGSVIAIGSGWQNSASVILSGVTQDDGHSFSATVGRNEVGSATGLPAPSLVVTASTDTSNGQILAVSWA